MPTQTSFLSLTLPSFQEFINSWDQPVNQNMEDIDAWLEDLSNSLIGTSTTAVWNALRGTHNSLADRLAVSINDDGTLDLTASPGILALASSSTQGTQADPDDDPRGRFDFSDFELYDARQSVVGGRFVPIDSGGAAGFPEEGIDAGIAVRIADFSAKNLADGVGPIASPQRPAASGHVAGGASGLITAPGGARVVRVDGSGAGAAAIFNIDGYLFRLREQIDLDYSNLTSQSTPGSPERVWIYVSRREADYGDSEIEYDDDTPAAKDLRVLQSNAIGGLGATVIASGIFTAATSKFKTKKIGKVQPGDTLVIDSAPTGKYVIDTVDTDLQLTIRGTFKKETGGLEWHIQDDHHPHIGAVVVGADPETQPDFVAGRVYIGRVTDDGAAAPIDPVNFAKGGVFDSGWQTGIDTGDFPLTLTHNLGVPPTEVSIFFRESATSEVYPPIVQREIVSEVVTASFPNPNADDVNVATLLFPSIYWRSTTEDIIFTVLNALPNNASPLIAALFTDSGGSDHGDVGDAVQMRVIAKR